MYICQLTHDQKTGIIINDQTGQVIRSLRDRCLAPSEKGHFLLTTQMKAWIPHIPVLYPRHWDQQQHYGDTRWLPERLPAQETPTGLWRVYRPPHFKYWCLMEFGCISYENCCEILYQCFTFMPHWIWTDFKQQNTPCELYFRLSAMPFYFNLGTYSLLPFIIFSLIKCIIF